MNALVRKNNALAAYLYLASLTPYWLPTIYLFIHPEGQSAPLLVIVMFTLFLAFLLAVGVQLKAGKTWAKVLVLLNAIGMVILCLYAVPSLSYSTRLTVLRNLAFFTLNVGTLIFLFKAYRAATSDARAAQGPPNGEA